MQRPLRDRFPRIGRDCLGGNGDALSSLKIRRSTVEPSRRLAASWRRAGEQEKFSSESVGIQRPITQEEAQLFPGSFGLVGRQVLRDESGLNGYSFWLREPDRCADICEVRAVQNPLDWLASAPVIDVQLEIRQADAHQEVCANAMNMV